MCLRLTIFKNIYLGLVSEVVAINRLVFYKVTHHKHLVISTAVVKSANRLQHKSDDTRGVIVIR